MRHTIKTVAAFGAALGLPQASYQRMVVVFSHMRSASTALCNVLSSHPDFSGYGETHVSYGDALSPGRVAVNLIRRRAFDARAPLMLDKVLHDELDDSWDNRLGRARAIFLVRSPGPAIASITKLSRRFGMRQTIFPDGAADYYVRRLDRLISLWSGFSPERRKGIATENLLADPDQSTLDLGNWLCLRTPLVNTYHSKPASQRRGGGDPDFSGQASRIEARTRLSGPPLEAFLSQERVDQCRTKHTQLLQMFKSD